MSELSHSPSAFIVRMGGVCKEDNKELGTKSPAQLDGQCQVGGAGGGCKGEKGLGGVK